MNLALHGNDAPPDFIGGTERVMRAQAEALRARGHEVTLVRPDALRSEGQPPTSPTPGPEGPGQAPARLPDLAHLHQWPTFEWNLVRRLARTTPVVVTLHDHFPSCPRSFRTPLEGLDCPLSEPSSACARCVAPLLDEAPSPELEARLRTRWNELRSELLAASAILCPSEFLRDSLSTQLELNPADWLVVPHGLCTPLDKVRRIRTGDPKLSVLSFGNRTSVKGCLDLVEAMAALPPRSARLILAGREVEAGFDDRLRRAAGDLELEIHGAYDSSDLARLAAGSDLAVFPSRAAESYGLVIEEALALGLPTLVSDRGAYPEVLRANSVATGLPGAVLPAESPADWTRALRELVATPETLQDARARISPRPRTSAEAVSALESIYSGLLRPLAAPRP